MYKKLLLLLIPAVALAQPTSVHYSALGDYLVDQDGHKTTITGHPHLVCYIGEHEQITGTYEKIRILNPGVALYMQGWSRIGYEETGRKDIFPFLVPNPVCDLK